MIFSIVGQWLVDGVSPNTGKPVLETRRIVKDGQLASYEHDGIIVSVMTKNYRTLYKVGNDYAIQLGRGQKAVGVTEKLISIERQDVREMTHEQAVESGFCTVAHYLADAWCVMHDPQALVIWNKTRKSGWDATIRDFLNCLKERPAERYDAWVLRFEAPPTEFIKA